MSISAKIIISFVNLHLSVNINVNRNQIYIEETDANVNIYSNIKCFKGKSLNT